jgi:hypothetical protein
LWPNSVALAQAAPAIKVSFLGRPLDLSQEELAAAAQREPVVRMLETSDRRDIAIVGLVAVKAPRGFLAPRLLALAEGAKRPGRTAFGVFSVPAKPSDLAGLEINEDDISALSSCRVGSCAFKLPLGAMTRAKAIIDSAGEGDPSRLTEAARNAAAALVNDVRARGAAAFPSYDDFEEGGVHGRDALWALLTEAPSMSASYPGLVDRIMNPARTAGTMADLFYWASDQVERLRPTITLSHLTVLPVPGATGASVAVTTTVYADHYFEAGTEVLAIVDQDGGSRGGTTCFLILRRYRFDQLPTRLLLFDIRKRVADELETRARADLMGLRDESEAAYAKRAPRRFP